MPKDTSELLALIGSRICHDLISPLGAIGNGVELLMMSSASASPEVALISESVANANARIRSFRVAFGVASPGQETGRAEILSILSDLTRGGRLVIDWQITAPSVPRISVKLAFLALQCFESAMPFGGLVVISGSDETGISIHGEARRLKVDTELWSGLNGANPVSWPDVSAAQVQFALLPLIAAEQGRNIYWHATETALTMKF